mmetsp:Transcript_97/g.213  ORF Transcript_97/g.213 Transcript_97/m.213 type:complete len:390 (-) Transcript_97:26-1195(-)
MAGILQSSVLGPRLPVVRPSALAQCGPMHSSECRRSLGNERHCPCLRMDSTCLSSARRSGSSSTTTTTTSSSTNRRGTSRSHHTGLACHAVAADDCDAQSLSWETFAEQVSGEWDGVSVTFDPEGCARELPEYYVPQAYRDWDVQLYDWQCQCSMTCDEEGVSCVTRKLMPTVGCEADAIAFTEEARRDFGFDCKNCVFEERGLATRSPGDAIADEKSFDCKAEHILTIGQGERIRIVHLLKRMGPEREWRVQGVEVYVEKRDGPYTGRRELAGCGGGMDPFAKSDALSSDSVMTALGRVKGATGIQYADGRIESIADDWQPAVGDLPDIVGLPKNCWTAFSCHTSSESTVSIHLYAGVICDDGNTMTVSYQHSENGSLVNASLVSLSL